MQTSSCKHVTSPVKINEFDNYQKLIYQAKQCAEHDGEEGKDDVAAPDGESVGLHQVSVHRLKGTNQ